MLLLILLVMFMVHGLITVDRTLYCVTVSKAVRTLRGLTIHKRKGTGY